MKIKFKEWLTFRNVERAVIILALVGMMCYLQVSKQNVLVKYELSAKSQQDLTEKLKAVDQFHTRMILKQDLAKKLPVSMTYGDKLVVTEALLDASIKFNIRIDILLAIIELESNFTKEALNPSGASGYMQLMPSTFASFSKKYGIVGGRFDPYANIMTGAAYLYDLRLQYGRKDLSEGALWIRILNQYATGQPSAQASFYTNRVLNRITDFS